MKKLAFLSILFLIQTTIFSQTKEYIFHVEVRGKGKPIILIPGLASSGDVWNQTTDSLEKQYECHVLTLPGFVNQKPITLENGYLPVVKKEIISYIQNELREKPIIIGHSLGGFLALDIGSVEPNLFRKIIIVHSYPFMSLAYNPNASVENVTPQAIVIKESILSTSDSHFLKQQKASMPTMITDTDKIRIATDWSLQSDRKTIAQAMYEIMTTDLRNNLENIKTPILVFGSWYAAKDYGITKEMVKTIYENQFSKAAHFKIEMANTAKHFIMWDEPLWFINSVKHFVEDDK